MKQKYNTKNYIYTTPYLDDEIKKTLSEISIDSLLSTFHNRYEVMEDFIYFSKKWLTETENTKINGLYNFEYFYIGAGIMQFLDDLITRENRKIFFDNNDYIHYRAICKITNKNWEYVDINNPSFKNGLLILSNPFSHNGNMLENYGELMEYCCRNNVKVWLDCAFFGCVPYCSIDVSYPCIEEVMFSFSKSLGLVLQRIGFRFSKIKDQIADIQIRHGYLNNTGLVMATTLLKKYYPTFIPLKYKPIQEKACKIKKILPSQTVWLGIDSNNTKICVTDIFSDIIKNII